MATPSVVSLEAAREALDERRMDALEERIDRIEELLDELEELFVEPRPALELVVDDA